MQSVKNLLVAFLDTLFLHTIRGSFLIGGLVLLLANTGAWQYFASSLLAHDVKRAAYWESPASKGSNVVVVAIDDAAYQDSFSAKSPLDRKRVRQLLEAVAMHAPNAKRIVVDLDLSPVPGQAQGQKALDEWLSQDAGRWVLVAENSGARNDIALQTQWRKMLCDRGVSFGLPSVPVEFGYPDLTHQYQGSLAATALLPKGSCSAPASDLAQQTMPLSSATLRNGLVIPFSGDLTLLGNILDGIDPEWVVVGGAWGNSDIFSTPFGDRYGVQLHAAALSGTLERQRMAPYIFQLFVAWLFVGFLTVLHGSFASHSSRWFAPRTEAMVGHAFFVTSVQPLLFVLMVFGSMLALAEILAFVHARTGLWIPTSVVGCTTLAALFFLWNWGKGAVREHDGFKAAWNKIVSQPIKRDLLSMHIAIKVLLHGPQPLAWNVDSLTPPVSRRRAAFEGVCAGLSLIMQTIAPAAAITYAVFKPL